MNISEAIVIGIRHYINLLFIYLFLNKAFLHWFSTQAYDLGAIIGPLSK